MELERLIELVTEKLNGGDDLEKIIDEFVDMELCSPEQVVQLRVHFTPPTTPDDKPPAVSMDAPLPAPSLPKPAILTAVPATEHSVPVLQIDWGADFKPGVNLAPNFTIKGTFTQQPLLFLKIPQISLEKVQELKKIANDWYFFQHLQIDNPGQYLCQVVAIDRTPGFSDPGYYFADFRIDVTDPKIAGQRRKVTIHAEENLTANLDRFGKDADIEIVGKNVALMARDESLVDKLAEVNKPEPDNVPNSTTTVPFLSDDDRARRVPYLSQQVDSQKRVRRLTMTESGTKHFVFIGGQRLEFGRDVPEQNIQNDIPLAILPGTPEEKEHTNEFTLLNGLLSREHARLEVREDGIWLVDARKSGIQEATILDEKALPKGCGTVMFPNDAASVSPRNVLFSKTLSMQFTPHYETFLNRTLRNNLAQALPKELLYGLYSIDSDSFTGPTSISISPDCHFKQKKHAEVLLKILKSTSLAESSWWTKWFANANNVNPRHETHEYWFVPLFVTLGRDHYSKIRLESRQWNDVQLRIVFINHSLHVENILPDSAVEFGFGDDCQPLRPFRPQPLYPGAFIRKGDAVLRFE